MSLCQSYHSFYKQKPSHLVMSVRVYEVLDASSIARRFVNSVRQSLFLSTNKRIKWSEIHQSCQRLAMCIIAAFCVITRASSLTRRHLMSNYK